MIRINNELISIVIPESVTHIDASSFRYNKITEINGEVSDGLIYARAVGGGEDNTAILGYGGEATVVDFIPTHVTKIDERSFGNANISEIIIPNSVTRIEKDAFIGSLLDMNEIVIPNSVVYIGIDAFSDMRVLGSFDLPTNIIGFENDAEWINDSGETVTEYERFVSSTYKVVGTLTNYNIVYNANGGSHSNTVVTRTVETEDITLQPVTRGSDTFTGWYDNDSFIGDPITEIVQGTSVDITLWAQFDVTTSINDEAKSAKIKLFPNPANSQITIENIAEGELIYFYNMAGTMVKQIRALKSTQIVSLSNIANGIYIVKVGNNSQRLSVKH